MKNTVHNADCLPAMRKMKDNEYSLALVDPPYGIGMGNYQRTEFDIAGMRHIKSEWDNNIPQDEYFNELYRISRNQIIWGGNYFPYLWKNGCKGFIFWYKHQPVDNYAKGELAWTSFDIPAKCFDYMYYGNINNDTGGRIHQTQKPIMLYKWLLKNYAKEGDTILDTHAGSMSSVIASIEMGHSITAYEIDKDYFEAGKKRVMNYFNQENVFRKKTEIEWVK